MRPLLILHGALGSRSQLDPLRDVLAASGYEVHSLNFSGHSGEPFGETFGIERFANDILHYLEKHRLQEIDIFGYSMGGYVALWFALHHPAQVSGIVTLGTKFDWSPESAAREIKKLDPEKIREKVPAFARILEHRHAPNDWKELLKKTADMMKALGEAPLLSEELLSRIPKPVLVLLGDLDDMADLEYSKKIARLLPSGQFLSLVHTHHPIERTDANKLGELIDNFLRSL